MLINDKYDCYGLFFWFLLKGHETLLDVATVTGQIMASIRPYVDN